jgi:hypothetical protein
VHDGATLHDVDTHKHTQLRTVWRPQAKRPQNVLQPSRHP